MQVNKKRTTDIQASNEANFVLQNSNEVFSISMKIVKSQECEEEDNSSDSEDNSNENQSPNIQDPNFEPPQKKMKKAPASETKQLFTKIVKSPEVSNVLDR